MSEVSAILYKCSRVCVNSGRIFRQQSVFKLVFVLGFATALFAGLWMLFARGFRFLDSFEGAGAIVLSRLFSLFFMGMGLMIAVSGIVTSYSTIFRSPEITFLLTRPFRMSRIVLYKFFESALLASWAFFFIIIPFVGAYTVHDKLPWLFSLWMLLFSVPFMVLCAGLGSILTLLCVRWMPRVRLFTAFIVLVSGLLVAGGWYLYRFTEIRVSHSTFILATLIPGLQLASNPLLPSHWMSEGVLALTRGYWLRGWMFWAVLASNAAMLCLLIDWLGRRTFFEAWQRVASSGSRAYRSQWLSACFDRVVFFAPRDVRAILFKDVRVFMRDPMQWSQVLVFFGLLGLYFANLRSFHYHMLEADWRNTIAFLNVFSVSSVMCSLGSRFVYPQLSLEGQESWILGLAPTSMTRVLLAKFSLSGFGMLVISSGLMYLSTAMLGLDSLARLVALGIGCALSLAISGMSIGFGAIFLDLRQRNPAAIVSGFGGTLNLVLCLAFMLAAILPFAASFHAFLTDRISEPALHRAICWAALWLAGITIPATVIPLALGARSMRLRDY